jgi:hypothetical protein
MNLTKMVYNIEGKGEYSFSSRPQLGPRVSKGGVGWDACAFNDAPDGKNGQNSQNSQNRSFMASSDEEIQEVYLQDIAKQTKIIRNRGRHESLIWGTLFEADGYEEFDLWTNRRWRPKATKIIQNIQNSD